MTFNIEDDLPENERSLNAMDIAMDSILKSCCSMTSHVDLKDKKEKERNQKLLLLEDV